MRRLREKSRLTGRVLATAFASPAEWWRFAGDDSRCRLALLGQFDQRFTPAAIPIVEAVFRRPVVVAGRVVDTTVLERGGFRTLTACLEDGTGVVELVFLGRSRLSGLEAGRSLLADGVIGRVGGRLRMLNPLVTLLRQGGTH